ncbi:MAG: hypothetical protein ACRDKX_00955 [Solirubrobacterales bacterium]
MRRVLLAVAVAALVALPATAHAQLPADNAGVDQYTESIPGAGGDGQAGGGGGSGGGGSGGDGSGGGGSGGGGASGSETSAGGSVLPGSVIEQFEQAGLDGVAAAALANETAPRGARRSGSGEGVGDATTLPAGSGRGGVAGVIDEVAGFDSSSDSGSSDSRGMGFLLPIILAAAALAALLFVLLRRRGHQQPRQA